MISYNIFCLISEGLPSFLTDKEPSNRSYQDQLYDILNMSGQQNVGGQGHQDMGGHRNGNFWDGIQGHGENQLPLNQVVYNDRRRSNAIPEDILSSHGNAGLNIDPVPVKNADGLRLYKCDECGKCFSRKDFLKRHAIIHTGLRPFVCDICGRGFNVKTNLAAHKVKLHYLKK